jgi:HNH endonuclease/EVE domain
VFAELFQVYRSQPLLLLHPDPVQPEDGDLKRVAARRYAGCECQLAFQANSPATTSAMAFWLFKSARQSLYPDVHGHEYVYDNTHSIRMQSGDIFVYLNTDRDYAFTGTGRVSQITKREPTESEKQRTVKVRTVFVAHIDEFMSFRRPLSISPAKKTGRANRAKPGIRNANLLGWSQSMPKISESWYTAILDLAEESRVIPGPARSAEGYSVPDRWGLVRVRQAGARFKEQILERHGNTCAVCGTAIAMLLDAAHISPYSADVENRANPANGLCLCAYCHRALDRRLIAINPNGELLVAPGIADPIALAHFSAMNSEIRRRHLEGVGEEFLQLTITWFNDCLAVQ